MSTTAMAETVGVSMALFDDNFLTLLRNGMIDHAKGLDGVDLRVEDAGNDVGKQLDQINDFIASGVDAIIVNREPIDVDSLPDSQAFVASDERESGKLEAQEVCRLLKEAGKIEANIIVIRGELSNQAAVLPERKVYIPFQLVTPENMDRFTSKNN